jgi:hypothetical protein
MYQHKNVGNSTAFSFIKPLYWCWNIDNTDMWGNHIRHELALGSELIWAILLNETGAMENMNSLDEFNNNGLSSGLIGWMYWTKNIFTTDNLNVSAGLNFGDYSVGTNHARDTREGSHLGLGPQCIVDFALNDKIAVGANIGYFKSLAHYTEDRFPNTSLLVYNFSPHLIMSSVWYVEASLMRTNTYEESNHQRFDINLGYRGR